MPLSHILQGLVCRESSTRRTFPTPKAYNALIPDTIFLCSLFPFFLGSECFCLGKNAGCYDVEERNVTPAFLVCMSYGKLKYG